LGRGQVIARLKSAKIRSETTINLSTNKSKNTRLKIAKLPSTHYLHTIQIDRTVVLLINYIYLTAIKYYSLQLRLLLLLEYYEASAQELAITTIYILPSKESIGQYSVYNLSLSYII
jgi:hypothetical protein